MYGLDVATKCKEERKKHTTRNEKKNINEIRCARKDEYIYSFTSNRRTTNKKKTDTHSNTKNMRGNDDFELSFFFAIFALHLHNIYIFQVAMLRLDPQVNFI